MKLWDKLLTYKVYAMRGYVSLVGWIITIGTFTMVLYENLIINFPWIETIFTNVFVFVLLTIPIGLVLLAFLGRWDYKRGTFPKEGGESFRNNPEWKELRAEVKEIFDYIREEKNARNKEGL